MEVNVDFPRGRSEASLQFRETSPSFRRPDPSRSRGNRPKVITKWLTLLQNKKRNTETATIFGLAVLVVIVAVALLNILAYWLDSVFPNEFLLEKGFLYLVLLLGIGYLSGRAGLDTLSKRLRERRDLEEEEPNQPKWNKPDKSTDDGTDPEEGTPSEVLLPNGMALCRCRCRRT